MPWASRSGSLATLVAASLLAIAVALIASRAASQSPPAVSAAQVDGSTLTITLSEDLTATSTAVAADFTVKLGDETQTVDSASIDGAVISLTLEDAIADIDCTDRSVSVSYIPSASSLVGVSGGAVESFDDQSVDNVTDAAPEITSVETDADGRFIQVTFCEPIRDISFQWSDFSAFDIEVDDNDADISDLIRPSDAPQRLDIQLSRSVVEGQSVTLAYDQALGDENYPLQDLDQGGKHVQSWSARSVTNIVDSPPTLQSASALYEIVTLVFSEALDEDSVPERDAFSIEGREITKVEISGDTVSLTLNGILAGGETNYTIDYTEPNESPLRQLDGGHNVADVYGFQFKSKTPTKKPEVTEARVNDDTLTVEFDLPLKNVAPATAFSIGGASGVTVAESSFSDESVTLTLSEAVAAGAVITISYSKPNAPPRIEARNNLDAASFTNQPVTNNTVAPAPEFESASISADGATLTITFSLALDESEEHTPDASTFSLAGGSAAVDSVAVSGSSVSLSLDPMADVGETITVDYSPPTDSSAARLHSLAHLQAVKAFMSKSVTNNADGKPRPRSATVDGSVLVVGFDRVLDGSSSPAASAFSLSLSSTEVAGVSIAGQEVTLTLSAAVTHLDTLVLAYTQPTESALKRAGQEIKVDSFASLTVDNLTVDPTPVFHSASIDATGRLLTIHMTGPLLDTEAGTPAKSAFELGGTTSAAVATVSISGSTVLLSLDPAADLNETATIGYKSPGAETDPALQSADATWKSPAWSSQSVDNRADGVPRPLGALANGAVVTLEFDRALDQSSVPAMADFSVTPAGHSVSAVSIDGASVRLTLAAPLAFVDQVTVSYSAEDTPRLKRQGTTLEVAAFGGFEVDNRTPEPLIRSVDGDGSQVLIAFSKELNTNSTPAASAFSLGVDGPTVKDVVVNSMSLSLTLATPLKEGAEYTLTYTRPSETPLRTLDDEAVASFSESLTNNTDTAAELTTAVGNGAVVILTFDQSLDGEAAVSLASFALSNDDPRTVTAYSIDGQTLTLTLSQSLTEDESVTLTYSRPDQGGVVDLTGNQSESFTTDIDNQTDTPPIPASGTIDGDEIVVILDQEIFADPRFRDEEGNPLAFPVEHFTLDGTGIGIRQVHVFADGPDGVGKIVVSLTDRVAAADEISITYFPTFGTIRIRDDDPGQQRAQINAFPLRNVTPASAQSASVDGRVLEVIFDGELDAAALPESAAFELVGTAAAVRSIAVEQQTLQLTLDESVVEDNDELSLSYSPPESDALLGVNSTRALGFEDLAVENLTDYAPYPLSAHTDADGQSITVLFDQRVLAPVSIDPSWFSTEPETDIDPVVRTLETDGEYRMVLTIGSTTPIRESWDITLSYSAPDSGGLQDDDAGNQVVSFSQAVTNSVDVAPQVENIVARDDLITITFDQPLNPAQLPPPKCETLESEIEDFECDDNADLVWFSVFGQSASEIGIEDIALESDTLTLTLARRLQPDEPVRLEYVGQSIEDGRFNLEDETGNTVDGFIEADVSNLTAARAVTASIDRTTPDLVVVGFDGPLLALASVDHSDLNVSVDGVAASVKSASAMADLLTIRLEDAAPECVEVLVEYDSSRTQLYDARNRGVGSFSLGVTNFIDREWALRCIGSDVGGVVLTFDDEIGSPDRPDHSWELIVNGEQRPFSVIEALESVELRPGVAICSGDFVELRYSGAEDAARLALNRLIAAAAPCALSAHADQVRLSVGFDSRLDESLPLASEFAISGEAVVESVKRVEGSELELQMSPPGLRAGQDRRLSYFGESLTGDGLTVAPFETDVIDETAAPTLENAYAFGTLVVLRFDQPLSATSIAASRFQIVGGGLSTDVESVSIGGAAVTLILADSLPDEPDLFGVVYLAGSRGGISGLTGARVPDSVFLVSNLTETPPRVESITADSFTITAVFDQQVSGAEALPSDFKVVAGLRTIAVATMSWSEYELTATLSERITSLDAVRVSYEPGANGSVRDTSGLPLAAFEIWAGNATGRPRSVDAKIDDARMRSMGGETKFERELAREFAASAGMRFVAEGGLGETTVVRGGTTLTVDASLLDVEPVHIAFRRLTNADQMLRRIDSTPTDCWNAKAQRVKAWLLDWTDPDGVPLAERMQAFVGGREAVPLVGGCVLDLIDGTWSLLPWDGRVTAPALLLERTGPALTTPIESFPGA